MPFRRRSVLIVGLVVVIFCVVLAVSYIMRTNSDSSDLSTRNKSTQERAVSKVCSDQIIDRAGQALRASDLTALQAINDEIAQIKDHSGDINCSYIQAQYYLMSGDIARTEDVLGDLHWAYRYGSRYSTRFDPPAVRQDELEAALKVAKDQRAERQKQISNFDISEN